MFVETKSFSIYFWPNFLAKMSKKILGYEIAVYYLYNIIRVELKTGNLRSAEILKNITRKL